MSANLVSLVSNSNIIPFPEKRKWVNRVPIIRKWAYEILTEWDYDQSILLFVPFITEHFSRDSKSGRYGFQTMRAFRYSSVERYDDSENDDMPDWIDRATYSIKFSGIHAMLKESARKSWRENGMNESRARKSILSLQDRVICLDVGSMFSAVQNIASLHLNKGILNSAWVNETHEEDAVKKNVPYRKDGKIKHRDVKYRKEVPTLDSSGAPIKIERVWSKIIIIVPDGLHEPIKEFRKSVIYPEGRWEERLDLQPNEEIPENAGPLSRGPMRSIINALRTWKDNGHLKPEVFIARVPASAACSNWIARQSGLDDIVERQQNKEVKYGISKLKRSKDAWNGYPCAACGGELMLDDRFNGDILIDNDRHEDRKPLCPTCLATTDWENGVTQYGELPVNMQRFPDRNPRGIHGIGGGMAPNSQVHADEWDNEDNWDFPNEVQEVFTTQIQEYGSLPAYALAEGGHGSKCMCVQCHGQLRPLTKSILSRLEGAKAEAGSKMLFDRELQMRMPLAVFVACVQSHILNDSRSWVGFPLAERDGSWASKPQAHLRYHDDIKIDGTTVPANPKFVVIPGINDHGRKLYYDAAGFEYYFTKEIARDRVTGQPISTRKNPTPVMVKKYTGVRHAMVFSGSAPQAFEDAIAILRLRKQQAYDDKNSGIKIMKTDPDTGLQVQVKVKDFLQDSIDYLERQPHGILAPAAGRSQARKTGWKSVDRAGEKILDDGERAVTIKPDEGLEIRIAEVKDINIVNLDDINIAAQNPSRCTGCDQPIGQQHAKKCSHLEDRVVGKSFSQFPLPEVKDSEIQEWVSDPDCECDKEGLCPVHDNRPEAGDVALF